MANRRRRLKEVPRNTSERMKMQYEKCVLGWVGLLLLPASPPASAGTTLRTILLLSGLREERPPTPRTLKQRNTGDDEVGEVCVCSGLQGWRPIFKEEDAGFIQRRTILLRYCKSTGG